MKIIHVAALIMLTSCTYNVNLIHTEGLTSDLIDSDQKANADISSEVPLNPF